MALPTLDATFASSADLPRKQMLAKWLVNLQYSGSIEDYYTLPEKYLYAKIAVAAGASRSEADYISLPDRYVWSDIYKAVSGSSADTIDRGEKEALGWIAAAVRGDAADPAKVATYISWPWRYQVASIITSLAVDADAQSFVTTSGATDIEGIDQFVKGVKNLGLWDSMVCWPLRSSQNAGTGTTAYSLGGLGTFNGTLVNGPTWGTNGIAFAPLAANSMQITGMTSSFPFEQIFVCSQGSGSDAAPTNYSTAVGDASISLNRFETLVTVSSVGTSLNAPQSLFNIPNATMLMKGRMESSTQLYVSTNASAETLMSPTSSTWGNSRAIKGIVDRRSAGNTTAFWAIFKAASGTSFFNLYKSTLGTGLGLP